MQLVLVMSSWAKPELALWFLDNSHPRDLAAKLKSTSHYKKGLASSKDLFR